MQFPQRRDSRRRDPLMHSQDRRFVARLRRIALALAAASGMVFAGGPARTQETDLQTIATPPRASPAKVAKVKPGKAKAAKAKPGRSVTAASHSAGRKKAAVRAPHGPAAAAAVAGQAPRAAAPQAAAPGAIDPMPTGTLPQPAAQLPAQAAAPAPLTSSPYPMPSDVVPIAEEKFVVLPAPAAGAAPAPPAIDGNPPQAAAATPPADMQPLIHARSAGVGLCLDALGRAAGAAIDGEHDAYSTWATRDADQHLFQSIALMRYPNQVAPRSASVLVVTPTAARSCEGGTVQVVPSARSCAAIQAQLMQGGKAIATLTGLPLIENLAGIRQILLPAPGNGCVMISVGLIAAPAAAAPVPATQK